MHARPVTALLASLLASPPASLLASLPASLLASLLASPSSAQDGVDTADATDANDALRRSLLGRAFPRLRIDRDTLWHGPDRGPLRGRPVLVVFTAPRAAQSVDTLRTLGEWRARFETEEVAFLAVLGRLPGADDDGAASSRGDLLRGAAIPVLDDPGSSNGRALGVKVYPSAYLLDHTHTVVVESSFRARDAARIEREIRRLVAPTPVRRFDYAAHIAKLRERLPHDGFHIVVEPPFVVVGDEAPAAVERRAARTVRWATGLLKRGYFPADPDHIIDVWLFKDRASYNKHTMQLFDERPFTPYGFYAARHKALIMNIGTGGGTLCHEIVHPYVSTNFPACPAWFNEGLGSLYEQCRERDGAIVGMTNWRLPILQRAIREEKVPTFERLCNTTDRQFYGEDKGVHYAQARYLCYYLQEHGLLRGYYRAFRSNHEIDPGGYETLRRVLRRSDMVEFQRDWGEFVLALRQ